ncbi:type I inositol polyphosphate 5-phosphatase 8 isoform X1 [Carica papaya]|uniref:type I inositol polyphosphate 5-phosphatase 8 isoform X1 n=1 Tax=Carica papaya TaxID=3649 RepID=UPI000B8CF724|nr:type I inositol polyphosphate 5-phosphatase 8 isoform X1 [Carica papaya]
MRTKQRSISKSSWPKIVVRKWLNIRSGTDEYHSDYGTRGRTERRRSCSDQDYYVVVPDDFSEGWLMEATNGVKQSAIMPEVEAVTDSLNLRMFVGTWNVGGKSPHEGLNLKDWLRSPAPADIYVLGFQEIVPLNAGNVLGAEDIGPAAKWLSLIRQALNSDTKEVDLSKPRLSFSDLLSLEDELGKQEFERLITMNSSQESHRFCLAASKQMVGIFLCVWVRDDLYKHIRNIKVSCVGRGLMGYLGNKGSISVSMTLHHTSFCFVCTHLTSGEKEGDELRRNSDVSEILKRTRFSYPSTRSGPQTILSHDKIVWLGDLNYRLAACRSDMHELLMRNDWDALLEKDQLRIEQRAGRVFKGWEEGRIYFAPTYKYLTDSDYYVVQTSKSKEKRRTPAWCDRILWKGEGLKQMWYVRGESRFSDHRPVYSLFSVQVNLATTKSCPRISTNAALSSTCMSKVQAEELLLTA